MGLLAGLFTFFSHFLLCNRSGRSGSVHTQDKLLYESKMKVAALGPSGSILLPADRAADAAKENPPYLCLLAALADGREPADRFCENFTAGGWPRCASTKGTTTMYYGIGTDLEGVEGRCESINDHTSTTIKSHRPTVLRLSLSFV